MKLKISRAALALASVLVLATSCGGDGAGGMLAECGNGTVETPEACDDGGTVSCDGCSASCAVETGYVCGDGILDPTCGEQCDDGNTIPGDGCDAECLGEACGDGELDAGEACDDGGTVSCDGCSASCAVETGYVCGDGILDPTCGEQCDDGNTTPGDGCDGTCQRETGPLVIGGDYANAIDTTLDTCGFGSGPVRTPMNVDERSETIVTVDIPIGGAGGPCNRQEFIRSGNTLTRIASTQQQIGACMVQVDVTTILDFFAEGTVTGSEAIQLSAIGGDCSGKDLPCAVQLEVTGVGCTGCFACVMPAPGSGARRPGLLGATFRDASDALSP